MLNDDEYDDKMDVLVGKMKDKLNIMRRETSDVSSMYGDRVVIYEL